MSWTPLAERFDRLPLILTGPILRRTEQHAVTVWLALKESQMVTLRIYAKDETGNLLEQMSGTRRTIRLGDHLHLVAVTAHSTNDNKGLAWGGLYYYDLFFQIVNPSDDQVPETAAHLSTQGILNMDSSTASLLERLVYPGHPLPGFVLPPPDLNQFRIFHGSCRKPHGVGKEMLSALDTILEDSAQNSEHRPQQLFLTGDQIYADDVAEPLLFAIIDAGTFLFSGNQEEVLPLVDVPARLLAPGNREDTVRNKAFFTSEVPESHLISLNEYTTMYLFAWSDLLWPDDLPIPEYIDAYPNGLPDPVKQAKAEAEYQHKTERLRAFRSALPQVRRALANIATYMICDDHDVTDDWYLDGAWCQRVLGNVLGRRIIFNALVAYALFQAWGNTPEQFDAPNGTALLEAVDGWHGDESDLRVATISQVIGLPRDFGGSGQLHCPEQALRWHYTFTGPQYHVIVMDTRTQRIYLTPNEFPGLLSPDAIDSQIIGSANKHAEVTLIISATPVLGVDFVEAIQFWSRLRSKNTYTYDPESWGLERLTFQRFLKAISTLKRVVILSGDVHFAFGSSLEYWDHNTKATAKIVDYTSSPLLNEGSGAQIAALTMGYPEFFHLLRKEEKTSTDLFAWDVVADNHQSFDEMLNLLRSHVFQFWWSLPKLLDIMKSPHEIVFPAQGWPQGAFKKLPPHRSYRLHYLQNIHDPQQGANQQEQPAEPKEALKKPPERGYSIFQRVVEGTEHLGQELAKRSSLAADAIQHLDEWLDQRKASKQIVGYANIGEIGFRWTEKEKDVMQRLWWWHPDNPERPTMATEYRDTLLLPVHDAAPPLP